MTLLEKDRAYTLSQLGPLASRRDFPAEALHWLRGRVPESMIGLLATLGIGTWGKGKWQTVDPRDYDGLLRQTLLNDPDFAAEDCTAFAIQGFGDLVVWHRVHRRMSFKVLPNRVAAPDFLVPGKLDVERAALGPFASVPSRLGKGYDLYDVDDQPMFARLVASHGPLAPGQIFAPRLHPAIGGPMRVENFRPASAPAATALLHQMEPFILMDHRTPKAVELRAIGRQ